MAIALLAGLLLFAGAAAASATGIFADDDGNVHQGDIEAIAAAGITKGCNPPANDWYCPDESVTRGAMAAFLARALGLTDDGGRDWFSDDDGHLFENDINLIAAAGITKGCNPPDNDWYCPDGSVTRGAMAAFLVRGFGYTDDGGGNLFDDDNRSIFENDIDKLGAAGVTRGCNPPVNDDFCPNDVLARDTMASFLARALGLDPIKPRPRAVDVASFDAVIAPGEAIQRVVDRLPEGSSILIGAGVHKRQRIVPKAGMTFVGESGAVLDGEGVTDYAFQAQNDSLTDVTVRGLEIRNYRPGPSQAAINGHPDAWLVEDVHVHHTIDGSGILVGSNGVVRNSVSHHNDRLGVKVGDVNTLIEGNEIYANNYRNRSDPTSEAGGTKGGKQNVIFRNNHIHDNNGHGIWIDRHAEHVLFEGNRIEDNTHSGISWEISYGAVIRRNTLEGNGFGDTRKSPWGAAIQVRGPDVEIYENHLQGNKAGVAVIAQPRDIQIPGMPPPDPRDIRVHQNTFVNTGENGVVVWGGDPIAFETTEFTDNEYRYEDPDGKYFLFDGVKGDFDWWQSLGQDLTGELRAS